ncbi:MAG: LysM peptidoglycan-binding domain-containing protein [Desulfuromonadaceae bacterium]|nr:LysM peptidoglycan-binding domain-containing protein [Desulfuromonadaceae bacterium]
MTTRARLIPLIAFFTCAALPAWGQQYLYVPQPVTSTQQESSQDGILVQEIEIQKGDTLSRLSRRYNGRGTYYPQILLFNSIKNPDLIYAGATLKVPLSQRLSHTMNKSGAGMADAPSKLSALKPDGTAHGDSGAETNGNNSVEQPTASNSKTELSAGDLKAGDTNKKPGRHAGKKAARVKSSAMHRATIKKQPASPLLTVPASQSPATSPAASTGQVLFESAVSAYRRNDCTTAVDLFDRYLADNSHTPLAADATLYRADCYLKLSAQ